MNIRYIGGLISAYDLLKSGQFSAKYDQQQVDGLLDQATKLADKCAFAYQTPSGIPAVFVNFTTNEPVNGERLLLSAFGSLANPWFFRLQTSTPTQGTSLSIRPMPHPLALYSSNGRDSPT